MQLSHRMDPSYPVQQAESDTLPQGARFSVNWTTSFSKPASSSKEVLNLGPEVKEKCQREAAYLFKLEQSFKNFLIDLKVHVLQPLVKAETSDQKNRPQLKGALLVLEGSLEVLCNLSEEHCLHLVDTLDTLTHKELCLLINTQRLKEVYVWYFTAFTNYVVLCGFEHIAKQTSDYWKKNKKIPRGFRLDLSSNTSLSVSLHQVFHEPICLQVQKYIDVLKKLSWGLEKNAETKPITDALATFMDLDKWIRQSLDVAILTKSLWNSLGSKLTELLFLPERRLREDSKNIPMSHPDGRILLFDDSLVIIQGSESSSYKLDVLWVEALDNMSSESGIMKWPDGRNYAGTYEEGQEHGFGVYVTPGGPEIFDCYKCHWKRGKMNGYGICEYGNGMTYKGYFQDNQRHGFGILHSPSLENLPFKYVGHWENDKKTGYGVFDDIDRGERYIGTWLEDCKHGNGIVITQSGLGYESIFEYNKLVGPGTILSEDDSAYEGEFTEELVLTGKGKLTFSNGYIIEGLFSNKWGSGLKANGIFSKPTEELDPLITSKMQLGSHITPAQDRWQGIYDQFMDFLNSGSDETSVESFLGFYSGNRREQRKNLKSWSITTEVETAMEQSTEDPLDFLSCNRPNGATSEKLAPNQCNLAEEQQLKKYLSKAFESSHHPLGKLLHTLILVFQATFSGICMHKRLCAMAQKEVVSHAKKLFELARYFLPESLEKVHSSTEGPIRAVSNAYTVTLPLILPRFYPDLFMLYMLYHEVEDSLYWKGILHLELLSDTKLLEFLEVQKNLWPLQDVQLKRSQRNSSVKDVCFTSAILCFQKISTTADPQDKLDTIVKTYREIESTVTQVLEREYSLSMDELLPLLVYVVSRARILHLGAELHLIRDMMDPSTEGGMNDFLLTALDSCYHHIQKEEIRTRYFPK
ncbi:ALS2 C-terminal-like protein isoform X2 [Heterodontus francisci]|uniref:ALS2 C-terminal-like protein isoform X2 n=1 Tax=Heterodontus francisci TaxID=7792 RepID=UPI00355C9782